MQQKEPLCLHSKPVPQFRAVCGFCQTTVIGWTIGHPEQQELYTVWSWNVFKGCLRGGPDSKSKMPVTDSNKSLGPAGELSLRRDLFLRGSTPRT